VHLRRRGDYETAVIDIADRKIEEEISLGLIAQLVAGIETKLGLEGC
jgi:hypothetical protein